MYFTSEGESVKNILFNSDALYIPTLYKDLFLDGYHITGWTMPGSPNFFPDIILLFLFMFLTGKTVLAVYLFAIFQFLSILLLFRYLIKIVLPEYSYYPMVIGNLLISLFFLVTFFNNEPYISFLLLSNTYHLGAFVNVLIALLLAITYIKKDRWFQLVLFFFIGLIAVISDRLFIVMFCVPFVGVLIVFLLNKKNYRKVIYLTGVIAIYVILGFVLFDRFTHNKVITLAKANFNFSIEGMLASWSNITSSLSPYFINISVFSVIIFLSLFAFILAMIFISLSVNKLLKGLEINSAGGIKSFLNLFFIFFAIVVFLSPILSGSFQGFDTIRYNVFILYFGLLYLGPLLILLFNEKPFSKTIVSSVSYIIVTLSIAYIIQFNIGKKLGNSIKDYINYYPEVAKCIDYMDEKHDLKHGLSTYWQGKVGTMFSKRNVRLYTVYDENLVPYSHVGNANWYYELGYGKFDPPIFNFILLKLPVNQNVIEIIEEKIGKIILTEEYGEFLLIKTHDFKYLRNIYTPVPLISESPSPDI